MKKYFIDQVIFLIIYIIMMIFIPSLFNPIPAVALEIIGIWICCSFCKSILCFPFDICYGKVTKEVYFAGPCFAWPYEFYKHRYYCYWKFYYGKKEIIRLIVPVALTKKEMLSMTNPPKDVKLKITYYRFSKVLLDWQIV